MEDKPYADYDEYAVSEDEFEPKSPPLKQSTDNFPKAELVQRVLNDDDFENDPYEYVRIRLFNEPQIFENQVKILSNTPIHISIAQFEAFEYKKNHSVIFRYYPNGSLQHLFSRIKKGENITFFDDTMKTILIFGIVSAVTHLHNLFDYSEEDYSIHYLCPENIVFDSDYQPKLINYFYGKENLDMKRNEFIPPELHKYPQFSRYVEDTWALGMIIYMIFTGHEPYQNKTQDEIKNDIINGILPVFPEKTEENKNILRIIKMCLNPNPAQRPPPYKVLHNLKFDRIKLFPNVDETRYELYKFSATEDTYVNKKNEDYSYYRMPDQLYETDPYRMISFGIFMRRNFGREHPAELNRSFALFQRAAEMNSPYGLLNAAICLKSGKGCEKDLPRAFEMLEKAAKMNCEKAIYLYCKMIHDGFGSNPPNAKRAYQIYEEYSEKNYKMCQFGLAQMLCYDEKGIPKDVKKGLSLFYRSAQNGYNEGFDEIGIHFYDEAKQGDEKKIQKAIKFFKKGGRQLSSSSLYNLGVIYRDGKFVEKDEKKCAFYFLRSAKLGFDKGMISYANCLMKGIGVDVNAKKAGKYFKKAADLGSKVAQHNFAKIIYDNQESIGIELDVAAKYFKMAADNGVPQSMFYYAKILIKGEGNVDRNLSEGKSYLLRYFEKTTEDDRLPGSGELYHEVQ